MITPWAPDFEEEDAKHGTLDTQPQDSQRGNCKPQKLMQARPKYTAGQKRALKSPSGDKVVQKRRHSVAQMREGVAVCSSDSVQQLGDEHLWITRSVNLPEEKQNGWVVAWIIESHFSEQLVSQATGNPCLGSAWRMLVWAPCWGQAVQGPNARP